MTSTDTLTVPEVGQLVQVRRRRYIVADVTASEMPADPLSPGHQAAQHLVALSSIEDDALGEELRVIWEIEPDAHVFDVRRKFERHLSLGYGAHFCVGAALARLEGRVAVEETINHAAAFGGFVSDRAASTPIHTSTVRGWESVRVRGAG